MKKITKNRLITVVVIMLLSLLWTFLSLETQRRGKYLGNGVVSEWDHGFPLTFVNRAPDDPFAHNFTYISTVEYLPMVLNYLFYIGVTASITVVLQKAYRIMGRKKFFSPTNVLKVSLVFGVILEVYLLLGPIGFFDKTIFSGRAYTPYEKREILIWLNIILLGVIGILNICYTILVKYFTRRNKSLVL